MAEALPGAGARCAACPCPCHFDALGRRDAGLPACAECAPRAAPEVVRVRTLAFDLDGTLFDTAVGVVYDDPESVRRSVRPHDAACRRVWELARLGHRIAYVTGRSEVVAAVTRAQIVDAGLPPVQMRGALLFLQRTWAGFETMTVFKAEALRAVGAALYVGDHEADMRAAKIAGVPFVHAADFRAGSLFVPRDDAAPEAVA